MFQKIFATLATYSICFQLILGGIPVAMLTSTSAQANTCAEGLEWNAILNRCLSSRQASQVQSASSRCQKITDKGAQAKCFNDAIDAQVKTAEDKKEIDGHSEVKGAFGSFGSGASILLSMASLYGSASVLKNLKSCPAATSAWIMAGGAAAVLAGEVMSGHTYKKKIKSYKKEFDELLAGTDAGTPSEIQAKSIDVMIKKEEATISAANTKNLFYKVATAAYSASAVLAVMEMIKEKTFAGTTTTCQTRGAVENTTTQHDASTTPPDTQTPTPNPTEAPGAVQPANPPPFSDELDGLTDPEVYININNKTYNHYTSIDTSDKFFSHKSQEAVLNSKTNEFIDAYFNKKTNISFSSFFKSSHVTSVNNWTEFYFAVNELKSFREGKLQSSSIDEYLEIKKSESSIDLAFTNEEFTFMKLATKISEQFAVSKAHAIPFGAFGMILGLGAIGPGAAILFKETSQKVADLYKRPITRLALSGVMITNNIFMIGHTSKGAGIAKKRKEFLEKLKTQIEVAGEGFGSCTPEQRNSDMSKPHCFCYLQGGAINTARVKSATCKTFFGSGLAQNVNRPSAVASAREERICTTPNATVIDETCSCRRTNTCTSIPRAGFTSTGVPPAAIANINETIDGLNNGSLDAQSIDPIRMEGASAALQRKKMALLNDPKNKTIKNNALKADKATQGLMRNLANQIANTPGLMNALPSLASSNSLGGNSNPQDEIKKLQDEFKKDMKQYEPGTIGGGNTNSLGAAGDDFSLDALSGGVTIEDEKLAEVMDTNFEATGSDINSNSDANIFQILTYRYQRSAMRRLFGGEAILPADKANETEISE